MKREKDREKEKADMMNKSLKLAIKRYKQYLKDSKIEHNDDIWWAFLRGWVMGEYDTLRYWSKVHESIWGKKENIKKPTYKTYFDYD